MSRQPHGEAASGSHVHPAVDGKGFQGNAALGGKFLEADARGLAIYYRSSGKGYLIASSQGDDTFHVFDREHPSVHVASFEIGGVGETDGHDVVNVPSGRALPFGLFAVQNGKAPPPLPKRT